MTESQFKRIVKFEETIWLCKDCFFNAGIYIHKDILPYNFDPSQESGYKMLGFKGTIIENEPNLDEILSKLDDFNGVLTFQATHWLFEKEEYYLGKTRKQLVRKYESQDSNVDIMIPNIYFENLPLVTIFANAQAPNQHPVYNEYRTIVTMPVII